MPDLDACTALKETMVLVVTCPTCSRVIVGRQMAGTAARHELRSNTGASLSSTRRPARAVPGVASALSVAGAQSANSQPASAARR